MPTKNGNAVGVAAPHGEIVQINQLRANDSSLCEHVQAIDEGELRDEVRAATIEGHDPARIIDTARREFLKNGGDLAEWYPQYQKINRWIKEAEGEAVEAGVIVPDAAPKWPTPLQIDVAEWESARLKPDTLVSNYLYADVALLIAPGGVGKTTLVLHEAACIVTGISLYGLRVVKSGPVLILTSEDSREMLIARLREIVATMGLMGVELQRVMKSILISDVSGEGFKLTKVEGDVVVPAGTIDQIIDGCRELKPVLIVIDPAVSFGVGEARVNDAEQGLVEAARKIRNALNCCVRYVHHSGKQNARDGAVDQYAGRGGSAFADGARMVSVLQTMKPDDWTRCTGTDLADNEVGLRLARPKLSYAPPQSDIFVLRRGYHFQHVLPSENGPEAMVERNMGRLLKLLNDELKLGHYHSRNTLEQADHGLNRAAFRKALARVISTGAIEDRPIPNRTGNRGAFRYLHPVASPPLAGEASGEAAQK